MFRYLPSNNEFTVRVSINGNEVDVPKGCSVWSAMAKAGETITRLSSVTEQERSAYCAMGVCFECLVEIDGIPNRQACLSEVYEGMSICGQTIAESSCLPYLSPNSTDISSEQVVKLFEPTNKVGASQI